MSNTPLDATSSRLRGVESESPWSTAMRLPVGLGTTDHQQISLRYSPQPPSLLISAYRGAPSHSYLAKYRTALEELLSMQANRTYAQLAFTSSSPLNRRMSTSTTNSTKFPQIHTLTSNVAGCNRTTYSESPEPTTNSNFSLPKQSPKWSKVTIFKNLTLSREGSTLTVVEPVKSRASYNQPAIFPMGMETSLIATPSMASSNPTPTVLNKPSHIYVDKFIDPPQIPSQEFEYKDPLEKADAGFYQRIAELASLESQSQRIERAAARGSKRLRSKC